MDIGRYLDEIERLWPQKDQPPAKEMVGLCLAAVAEHPESSTLWYDLAVILQRCDEDSGYTAEDYLHCLEKALECNPDNSEAYQELGYVFDVYFSDYASAEQAFEKAIRLGANHEAYYGRARAVAQAGRRADAINSLSQAACPFHDHPDIQKLWSEILDGSWGSSD